MNYNSGDILDAEILDEEFVFDEFSPNGGINDYAAYLDQEISKHEACNRAFLLRKEAQMRLERQQNQTVMAALDMHILECEQAMLDSDARNNTDAGARFIADVQRGIKEATGTGFAATEFNWAE